MNIHAVLADLFNKSKNTLNVMECVSYQSPCNIYKDYEDDYINLATYRNHFAYTVCIVLIFLMTSKDSNFNSPRIAW